MTEKTTRAIPPKDLLRSPIESLAVRTRSGKLGPGELRVLTFQFQRPTKVEGFDFLDCDASVKANSLRVFRVDVSKNAEPGSEKTAAVKEVEDWSGFVAPISLCDLDSRIYGNWSVPGLAAGDVLELELEGGEEGGRYGFILRTVELP